MNYICRAHRLVLYALSGYIAFLLLLSIPYVQRGAIFLHWVRLPIGADFKAPEKYGIIPGKVRNFYLKTPDGAEIGVWHAIPEGVYVRHSQKNAQSQDWFFNYQEQKVPEAVYDSALKTHKTVLYSHGNAASRAQGFRTSLLRGITNPVYGACDEGMNFVTYDYRGFADSSPAKFFPPSEEGLILDAKTVWDWIVNSGAHPNNITIAGQSLGTGVSAALAQRVITKDNAKPKALCLVAPFTSIPELLRTYSLFKLIPILQPFAWFPHLQAVILDKVLLTKFNTKELISSINTSILLIHAKNDKDVPPSHSRVLLEKILQNSTIYHSDQKSNKRIHTTHHTQAHFSLSEPDINFESLAEYGEIYSFNRVDPENLSINRVIHLDANQGGHNLVGYSETALRSIADLACKNDL
ncbi:Alpha/Beta hydrolase protein [Phakopsora pachyrhizi]|uniref:Alpha/Beta hydrolase protein n=1 Tax=Phakopsora pachyrhizi TaxID=170000 RepID=A0AAV0AIN2_PHAPC|nr:Alpha/Beta hydrolase protein [Phakopsora pachyrhizi]CAH7668300.1 Alpha/Beta hydrolase protein [Phakopsora pachyrhizi]